MKLTAELTRGFFRENPVFVLLLGLCPTLAVTTGLKNALGMGLAATFVLIASNLMISIFKKLIPKEIRIPVYIIIIAAFVTVVKLLMAAYMPVLKEALGIFLPLIVVNCIILGRAEAFASKNAPLASMVDGLGMGLGFTLALSLIGIVREVLGSWQLLGIPVADGLEPYALSVFIIAPGGFLTLGLLLALFNHLANCKAEKAKLAEKAAKAKPAEPAAPATPAPAAE
jgi:electron transport complex protein RnfE